MFMCVSVSIWKRETKRKYRISKKWEVQNNQIKISVNTFDVESCRDSTVRNR